MNGKSSAPATPKRAVPLVAVGIVAVAVIAMWAVARGVDTRALAAAFDEARARPADAVLALAGFAGAFVLRAVAWRRVVPGLSFAHAWSSIHVALGANHLLPLRLGEPLRVVSAVRRGGIGAEAATASTVTLRVADLFSMVAIGIVVAPSVTARLLGGVVWLVAGGLLVVGIIGWWWLVRLGRERVGVRAPGPLALGLSAAAWLAESVLVWMSAGWAGIELGFGDAVFVATVSVAAQVVAVAPGGFGTYEAAAVAAYVALGADAGDALVAALAAHALKTAYSLAAGSCALMWPSPGFVGRLRLAEPAPKPPNPVSAAADAPVVLFMPAHDEEDAVEPCVRRVPRTVLGRRVEVVVVDDGSTDATVERARRGGADVVRLGSHHGLGAAVRAGLEIGVARGAAVVAFCDADGEYPPEELAALVAPILGGQADYVVGSRFNGDIERMRPHRRLGNMVLTRLLSIVARRRITDGQSGYRALSAEAAADAEIIHDYNYAQVLTLDLLGKGHRYVEVPISYRFRTTGKSFVRLWTYLRRVAPAVYRELNAQEREVVAPLALDA